MAALTAPSPIFPLGSAVDERGHLLIGGCDAVELAREFGTPAYVVAEDDLRERARSLQAAFTARHADAELVFAAKAFPAVAVLRLFAEEGLGADVAGVGELAVALRAGHAPGRIHLHGNAKTEAELDAALDAGVGHVVADNLDELHRLHAIAAGRPVRVALRVTPDVAGDTHRAISTGQADSKFGFGLAELPEALAVARERFDVEGLHAHIGSQLLDLDPFRRAVAALAPHMEGLGMVNLGGGLGAAYPGGAEPPSHEAYAEAKVAAVHEHIGTGVRILDEPGRALVANGCVTLYTVQSVKRNVRTYVAVDGGMSDNLRPMLYDARYEVHDAARMGAPRGELEPVRLVGRHCESGDVLVPDGALPAPAVGGVVAVPATGAYGHAMANQYNGQLRPPVIFCSGGDARVVVRRDTFEDLLARDA